MHHQVGELRTGFSSPCTPGLGASVTRRCHQAQPQLQTLRPPHKDTSGNLARAFLLKIALSTVSKMSSQRLWELALGIKSLSWVELCSG